MSKSPRSQASFASDHGRRLATSHVTRMLRRICAAFGAAQPPRHAVPHQLRHSYATHAAAGGVATRQIKIDLGHQSESTTEGYIRDDDSTANSAVHELSPALHRGWLGADP